MDADLSLADLERFGIQPESGARYQVQRCGCQNEFLVECKGGQGEVRTYQSKCPFCHGDLTFKTQFADVDFHFDH